MKKNSYSFLIALFLIACLYAQKKVEMNAINTIKKEGLEHSKVIDLAF